VIAAIAVVLAVVIRTFVFQAFYIPSGSMLPTLNIGDRILLDKLFFSPSSVHTGDIVVFARPPAASCAIGERNLVKRVIGTPGETLSSNGNTILINGKPMPQTYLPRGALLGPPITTHTIYGQTLPVTIPPGKYFVMGDNRTNSCDSRYWGYVSANEIVGKVVLDWWHNNRPAFRIF
jgi:signal peptidase I